MHTQIWHTVIYLFVRGASHAAPLTPASKIILNWVHPWQQKIEFCWNKIYALVDSGSWCIPCCLKKQKNAMKVPSRVTLWLIKRPLGCPCHKKMWMWPLRWPSSGENLKMGPLGCLFSGQKVIKCPLGCYSSGKNGKMWPLDCPFSGENMKMWLLFPVNVSGHSVCWSSTA